MIRVQGVHHVKVPVSDLVRSRAWYEAVLPLQAHLEFPDDTGTVRGVVYGALGGLTLTLREDPERAQALSGFDPFAVLVPQRIDLDAISKHLDLLGVGHGPIITATKGWLLSVPDPDGIQLRFYTAEEHEPIEAGGGHGVIVGKP